MKRLGLKLCLCLAALSGFAIGGPANAGFTVFEATGFNVADIAPTLTSFRTALGTLNPNNGSAFADGRREVNWDAVPDNFADPNLLPGDFFNSGTTAARARGISFSTPGTGFLVTADSSNPTATPTGLSFPADFRPFSPERLFTPIGSLTTNVTFSRAGTPAKVATTSAFGAVFSDVEITGLTTIEVFGTTNNLLFQRSVLRNATSGSFSFLGVQANAGERIGSIRIKTGDIVVFGNNSFGGGSDAALLDDFIYAEPQAVPEPSSWILLTTGAFGLFAWRRRNLMCTTKS